MKNEKEKFNHHNYRIGFYADFCIAFGMGGKSRALSRRGGRYRCWSGRCRECIVEYLFVFTPADKGGIPVCGPLSSQILLFQTLVSKTLGSAK
jgi:hypothetical protein